MTPEECSLVESIQKLLAQLKEQTRAISTEEVFLHVTQSMDEIAADVREVFNARRPLLSIPTELLQNIMAFIPNTMEAPSESALRPTWHAKVYDTAMIIPISQTCRRLREVALGCPTLWTSLTDGSRARARLFAQRSRGVPLKVFLPIGRIREYDLADIAEDLPSRVQELHVGDLPSHNTKEDLERMFVNGPLPMLESLSVQLCDNPLDEHEQYHLGVPGLTQEQAPRLRRLYLGSCYPVANDILSSLTHLALHDITVAHVHKKIKSILSSCHALESLHLEEIQDFFNPHQPLPLGTTPHGFYHLTPSPHLVCRRLRRVALLKMYGYLTSFVLSLVLADQPGLALQLHDIRTQPNPALPLDLLAGTSRLAIGRYIQRLGNYYHLDFPWGITALSPARTVRATSPTLADTTIPLFLDGSSEALASVRELWLTDIPPVTPGEDSAMAIESLLMLKTAIAAMPALDTVVLANQRQVGGICARPSLHLLPDSRDAVSSPPISTLRIVYGYGPEVQGTDALRTGVHARVPPLDLTGILGELASGAYDYLEHLVLEVPHRVAVDIGDLARLRAQFKTAEVRMVDEMPDVALPAYCVEPAAWPGDPEMPWPCRLW